METYRQSRSISVLVTVIAYAIAILTAIYTYRYFGSYSLVARIALADLAGTVMIFIFSVLLNNSSVYDPYWSVKPVVIAVFLFSMAPGGESPVFRWVLLFLVFLYGLRLTSNFYRGWPGLIHEDWRYADFRKKFPGFYWIVSLLGIHLFPTLMVFLGCLPLIPAFTATGIEFPLLAIAGLVVLLGAVLLAFVADEQLRKIKKRPAGDRQMTGLWRLSRHPNYLGEILTWWGIFFAGLSFGMEFLWTGIGAVAITLLFVFISIPLMENRLRKKHKDYENYREKVPALLPLIYKNKNRKRPD